MRLITTGKNTNGRSRRNSLAAVLLVSAALLVVAALVSGTVPALGQVIAQFTPTPTPSVQSGGPVTYTGTIYTSSLQPVPAGTTVTAVSGSTGAQCGQGVVGGSGAYTVVIAASPACTTPGTTILFKAGNYPTTPNAFISSGGSVTLNLTAAGFIVSATPVNAPAGTTTSTTAPAGVLVPPITPPTGAAVPQATPAVTAPSITAATGAVGTVPSSTGQQTLTRTTAIPVTRGCNVIVVAFGPGATPQQVVSAAANPGAVLSIWRFDNASQQYHGYFVGGAPSDLTALQPVDSVFVCVSADTTITTPQPS